MSVEMDCALDENTKERVHISEADTGQKGLVAYCCEKPVIARKGEVYSHHFAHKADSCGMSYEHRLAQYAVLPSFVGKEILVPVAHESKKYYELKLKKVSDVLQEQKLSGHNYYIDNIVVFDDKTELLVEFFNTSKVNGTKWQAIKSGDTACVEYCISNCNTYDDIYRQIKSANYYRCATPGLLKCISKEVYENEVKAEKIKRKARWLKFDDYTKRSVGSLSTRVAYAYILDDNSIAMLKNSNPQYCYVWPSAFECRNRWNRKVFKTSDIQNRIKKTITARKVAYMK